MAQRIQLDSETIIGTCDQIIVVLDELQNITHQMGHHILRLEDYGYGRLDVRYADLQDKCNRVFRLLKNNRASVLRDINQLKLAAWALDYENAEGTGPIKPRPVNWSGWLKDLGKAIGGKIVDKSIDASADLFFGKNDTRSNQAMNVNIANNGTGGSGSPGVPSGTESAAGNARSGNGGSGGSGGAGGSAAPVMVPNGQPDAGSSGDCSAFHRSNGPNAAPSYHDSGNSPRVNGPHPIDHDSHGDEDASSHSHPHHYPHGQHPASSGVSPSGSHGQTYAGGHSDSGNHSLGNSGADGHRSSSNAFHPSNRGPAGNGIGFGNMSQGIINMPNPIGLVPGSVGAVPHAISAGLGAAIASSANGRPQRTSVPNHGPRPAQIASPDPNSIKGAATKFGLPLIGKALQVLASMSMDVTGAVASAALVGTPAAGAIAGIVGAAAVAAAAIIVPSLLVRNKSKYPPYRTMLKYAKKAAKSQSKH